MRAWAFASFIALVLALPAPADPVGFFGPLVALDAAERRSIEHGDALAKVVPPPGGHSPSSARSASTVDVLGGVFGGVVRFVAARRLNADAVEVLQGLRRRLERGEPPHRATIGSLPHDTPGT